MSIWNKLFGPISRKSSQLDYHQMRDRMIELLQESYHLYENELRAAQEQKIKAYGQVGFDCLKAIALDKGIQINIRKEALCQLAKFPGNESARFIAENFVNGKDPSKLYSMYESGEDRASFPLFRQGKECLEKLGYRVIRQS